MSIYDYQTFEINSLVDVKNLKQKYHPKKINLLHRYTSIIWQGPLFVKIINEKLKSSNLNYIVELGNNIGLTLVLLSLKIKFVAIDKRTLNKNFDKIQSIIKQEEIKVLSIERLNIIQSS